VLARAREAGVRLFAVTSRPSDFRTLFPLYGRRAGVRLALGLHPLEVQKIDLAHELELFASYALHTSYIGEIGLDFSRDGRESRAVQERALEAMLQTPNVADKLMTLHSRGAAREVIAALRAGRARRAILHWYTGALRELDSALEAGFFFSINPSMIRAANGQRTIAHIPHERVLVETDGPYARVRGRSAEPPDVWLVIDYLAEQWRAGRAETATIIDANLRRLLKGL
jgi:TatD DNase family protein